jgi:hypothetical protein
MECESMDWIQVVQNRVCWHVFVNTDDVLSAIHGRKFLNQLMDSEVLEKCFALWTVGISLL